VDRRLAAEREVGLDDQLQGAGVEQQPDRADQQRGRDGRCRGR
jgi:hypothetical protein